MFGYTLEWHFPQLISFFFFFQAEDGIRDYKVTGVQTCALPISDKSAPAARVKTDLRDILGPLGPKTDIGRSRRALLPGWMKFFSWLFLLVSAGVPVAVLTSIVTNAPISFTLFGLRYVGMFNAQAALLAIAIGGCGSTAYGLLWGRSWGLFAGALTGWGGLACQSRRSLSTPRAYTCLSSPSS